MTLCLGCTGQLTEVLWTMSYTRKHIHLNSPSSLLSLLSFVCVCVFFFKYKTSLGCYLNVPLYFLLTEGKVKREKSWWKWYKRMTGLWKYLLACFRTESSHHILELGIPKGNESEIFPFLFFGEHLLLWGHIIKTYGPIICFSTYPDWQCI